MWQKRENYIDPFGADFTEHIHNREDEELFDKMVDLINSTKGVQAKDCLQAIEDSLNLGNLLLGRKFVKLVVMKASVKDPNLN